MSSMPEEAAWMAVRLDSALKIPQMAISWPRLPCKGEQCDAATRGIEFNLDLVHNSNLALLR
jgi:hypothetical protein